MKNVTWKTVTTRTGPNNASCVVGAVYKPVPSQTAPGSEGETTGQGGYHLHHHPYYRKRLEAHLRLEPLVYFLFLYISTTRRRVIPSRLAHQHQLTSGLQLRGIYPKHNLHVNNDVINLMSDFCSFHCLFHCFFVLELILWHS